MPAILRIVLILILFLLMAGVRFFEQQLFYDPLLAFFRRDYHHNQFPDMDTARLMLHTALRYGINTVLSLLVLWLAFRDRGIVRFSAGLYLLVFGLLFVWMWILLSGVSETTNFQTLFYVRRFLIQPLLILLLLPAFYYHKRETRHN